MSKIVFLSVFGLAGIFARYLVNTWVAGFASAGFPFATLAINITGSFLIGVVYVAGMERMLITADLRIGLMTGFLGGFTTFSAFSLESVALLSTGSVFAGLLYIFSSVGGGLIASALGLYVGRHVMGG